MARVILFLVGIVLGAFGLLILQAQGLFLPPRDPVPLLDGPNPAAPRPSPGQQLGDEAFDALVRDMEARLAPLESGSVEGLAVVLEEALFDRDWAKVEACARVVRRRGASWLPRAEKEPAPPLPPPVELPLVARVDEVFRQVDDRARAARRNEATALRGRTDRQAIARLIELASEADDEGLRGDAATILAQSGDEQGLAALVELVRTGKRGGATAALALARVGNLEGAQAMADVLAQPGEPPEAAKTAVLGLASYVEVRVGEDHTATRALLTALDQHADEQVRAAVAAHLGDADLERADAVRESLLQALKADPSEVVRAEAAASVLAHAGRYGVAPGAVDVARARLAAEESPLVLAPLIRVLGYGGAEALAALDGFAATSRARVPAVAEVLGPTRDALRRFLDEGR